MDHLSRLFLIICAVVFVCGCQTPGPVPTSSSGVLLSDICKQYNIQWQLDSVTQVILLEYKGQKAKALVGSSVVLIGEQKITLDAPLRRINSNIYVPEDFESKVINPFGAVPSKLGFTGELDRLRIRTVVIDAGHGGKDPGARGVTGIWEKEVVLDVSKRLKSLLSEAGLKVIMTRSSDEYLSLNERTEIATKTGADLFVSIHANSNPSRRMQGFEVYVVKTSHKRDLDEEQRSKNERMYLKSRNAVFNSTVQAIVADMMYQHKIAESYKLATKMAHYASHDVGMPNRGVRHSRFFVVRNTLVPAVLIEMGYLTNRQEEKKLKSGSYRSKLAESFARSILSYASSS